MDRPTVLVVFGATGDLMTRKIVPALAYLSEKARLPERFATVGFSRRDWDDDAFRSHVAAILDGYDGLAPAEGEARERFLGSFRFVGGTFEDAAAFARVGETLKAIDDEWGVCCAKLFYLAVPPEAYADIFNRLAASGLTEACGGAGVVRVLVEKPFGSDLATARELDELLGSLFAEEQIYRIDHYLAKEMLQGILNFRFSNTLFEPSWKAGSIARIDISLLETLGVEKRGAFYDGVGALRDVGQNHLLQMLALVCMDQPKDLAATAVRAQRARMLQRLVPPSREHIVSSSFRAQYDGYCQIAGVAPDSQTETYFRLRFLLEDPRWGGVPVMLESGKRMPEAKKCVSVTFRAPSPCLCDGTHAYENVVTFTLAPDESIKILFWAKKPGFDDELEQREFTFFLYEKEEKAQYVEEYARLLLDAIAADQTLFVSTEEVRAMWAFIDPIVQAWQEGATPLESYRPDTDDALVLAAEALAPMPTPELRPELSRRIGVCGLGKMGANLARNLLDHSWEVVGYNRTFARAQEMASVGLAPAETVPELVAALAPPRVVWLMVPAGKPVDDLLDALVDLLEPGDIVIDGGNSYYKDTARRSERLESLGIEFLDCGTSGGPGGARRGACLMVGGKRETFERLRPLWADIAVEGGYRFFDGHGAGHFVKMVHNGIEYGMMQALAEGFTILHHSDYSLDLTAAADVYNHGSVITSSLVGWLKDAFELHGSELDGVSGMVGHTGEGEWTVQTAEEHGLEDRVIRGALEFRRESERGPSYTGRILTALRDRFGGHGV